MAAMARTLVLGVPQVGYPFWSLGSALELKRSFRGQAVRKGTVSNGGLRRSVKAYGKRIVRAESSRDVATERTARFDGLLEDQPENGSTSVEDAAVGDQAVDAITEADATEESKRLDEVLLNQPEEVPDAEAARVTELEDTAALEDEPVAPAYPIDDFIAGQPDNGNVRPTAAEFQADLDDTLKGLDDIIADLNTRWELVENKPAVAIYAWGAVLALWLSSRIIGAIIEAVHSVPLLPEGLELVGFGYTSWFAYRFLLYKSEREELFSDIEDVKKKVI